MTPFVDEAKRLLRIAGRDYQTFTILRNHPEAELAPICFHAQQAIEKALKAVLTINRIDFRRTHDLEELANLLADIDIASFHASGIPPPESLRRRASLRRRGHRPQHTRRSGSAYPAHARLGGRDRFGARSAGMSGDLFGLFVLEMERRAWPVYPLD